MRTTLLTRQHERCLGLLEMIEKVDQRIATHKKHIKDSGKDVAIYCNTDWHFKRWETNIAIKERLAKSYSSALTTIIKPTVDKILISA